MAENENAPVDGGGENTNTSSYNFHYTAIDRTMAERHIHRVAPTGQLTFQTFDDNEPRKAAEEARLGYDPLARTLAGTFDEHFEELAALNAAGAGVFLAVNEHEGPRRQNRTATRGRSLVADLDGPPLEPVMEGPLKPLLVVRTSEGRDHAYWPASNLTIDQFTSGQKAVAERFHGDPGVHDPARVFRLAGFVHNKVKRDGSTKGPFLSHITYLSDAAPYTLAQLCEAFPAIRDAKPRTAPKLGTAHDPVLQALDDRGMILRPGNELGKYHVVCPWGDEHSDGNDESVYFEAHTNGYAKPNWKCLHAHCASRTFHDLLGVLDLADGRPAILVQKGNLPGMVSSAIDALKAANVPVYDRGGQLVRPVRAADAAPVAGVKREGSGGIILAAVVPEWLRLRLAEAANWEKWDGRSEKAVAADPPMDICRTLVIAPDAGDWPQLRSVVRHPVLTPTGRLINTNGFDAETGLLLDLPEGAQSLPEVLDLSAAQAAVSQLCHLLRHYPWVGEADRSVALSLLLTALARPVLPTAPMHAADAPTPGTGKSLLVDTPAVLATGGRAAVIEYGRDPVEAAKRIDAALLAGDPVLTLDNIEAPVEGAALCQTLTQLTRRIRLLGASTMVSVPCTSLIAATGNNLIIRGDMVRRTITCRLDAGTDSPEQREIQQDLIAEVTARRGELIRACLTIMAAYIQAGSPDVGLTPLGSFEEWSRMVRSALVWAGCADPCEVMDRARADDPERQAVRAVLIAWRETYGDESKTAKAVVGDLVGREDLHDALELVARGRFGIDSQKLGCWLRDHCDGRAGPLQLVRVSSPKGRVVKWRVVDTSAPTDSFHPGDTRSRTERSVQAHKARLVAGHETLQ